jgi:hypothetical protein
MKKKIICMLSITVMLVALMSSPVYAWSQTKKLNVPGRGTLESYTWRSILSKTSGNSIQWDYEVKSNFYYSSDYTRRMLNGDKDAQLFRHVRADIYGEASLKNSGSLSIVAAKGFVFVTSSSSWQPKSQSHSVQHQYYVQHKSNFIVGPKNNYMNGSVYIKNTAVVTFHDWRVERIASAV